MCLAQGHNALTMVRLEPAALMSQVKHYTTEPLRSYLKWDIYKNRTCVYMFIVTPRNNSSMFYGLWNHISISINKLLEIHSRPLSKWSLIIFNELIFCGNLIYRWWERSGSEVECLTRDRGVAGSSLTGVTALWSLSKTHLS